MSRPAFKLLQASSSTLLSCKALSTAWFIPVSASLKPFLVLLAIPCSGLPLLDYVSHAECWRRKRLHERVCLCCLLLHLQSLSLSVFFFYADNRLNYRDLDWPTATGNIWSATLVVISLEEMTLILMVTWFASHESSRQGMVVSLSQQTTGIHEYQLPWSLVSRYCTFCRQESLLYSNLLYPWLL